MKLNSILSLMLVAMFVLGGFASLTSLETAANAQAGEDDDKNAVDTDDKSKSDRVADLDAAECQELLAKYDMTDKKVEMPYEAEWDWRGHREFTDSWNVPDDEASGTEGRDDSDRADDQESDRVDEQESDRVDDQDDRDIRLRIERLRQAIQDRVDRDRDEQREEIAMQLSRLRTACGDGNMDACGELRVALERLGYDDDERRGDDRQDRRRGGHHGHRGDWGDRDRGDHRNHWGDRGGEEVTPRFIIDDLDDDKASILKQCLQFVKVEAESSDCLNSDWKDAERGPPPIMDREWDELQERDVTRD